uniref:ATP synthase F0 subunit 8 n=1 Tax=Polyptychus trilineatus TaxID=1087726 RepID=UPI001FAF5D9C|nr:ATP synthase F0 subunit 8 [Polyptychus trilineatus]UNP54213.1 ATP synthase F0 subunit 8 [Polyptychus trilineatus]
MPQMMPINWILSLFFFICIYIMFNIMNYYIYSNLYKNNHNNKFILKNNFFWKW